MEKKQRLCKEQNRLTQLQHLLDYLFESAKNNKNRFSQNWYYEALLLWCIFTTILIYYLLMMGYIYIYIPLKIIHIYIYQWFYLLMGYIDNRYITTIIIYYLYCVTSQDQIFKQRCHSASLAEPWPRWRPLPRRRDHGGEPR